MPEIRQYENFSVEELISLKFVNTAGLSDSTGWSEPVIKKRRRNNLLYYQYGYIWIQKKWQYYHLKVKKEIYPKKITRNFDLKSDGWIDSHELGKIMKVCDRTVRNLSRKGELYGCGWQSIKINNLYLYKKTPEVIRYEEELKWDCSFQSSELVD